MKECWQKWKKKRCRAGETLTETLISLLITSFAMLILPGAIVASAKMDKVVEEQMLLLDDYTKDDASATLPARTDTIILTIEDSDVAGKNEIYRTDAGANSGNKINVTYYGTQEEGLYQYEVATGTTP